MLKSYIVIKLNKKYFLIVKLYVNKRSDIFYYMIFPCDYILCNYCISQQIFFEQLLYVKNGK